MALDLENLRQAITALEGALNLCRNEPFMATQDEMVRNVIRAGAIQHFEFTYELCWKFMQRWLDVNVGPEEAEHYRTRKGLFRLAALRGLIADPLPWFDYSEARNLTSHAYSQEKAWQVYHMVQEFAPVARDFLERLERLND